MENAPRVTVLMAVYNGARHVGPAIERILRQSLADFEFIIIDDASTDGTLDILVDYAAQDRRIRIERNPENIGLTRSLNRGLEMACGDYVARQDADDISAPERLEKQVAWLDAHPDALAVSSVVAFVNPEGEVTGHSGRDTDPALIAWYLLFYNYLPGHSVMVFRRAEVIAHGAYDPACPVSQDYELWQRLSRVGDIGNLPDVLLRFQRHEASISRTRSDEQDRHALRISANALADLTGEAWPEEDIRLLRQFWIGPFPPFDSAGLLSKRLEIIFRAFLRLRRTRGENTIALGARIAGRIAVRYFRWSQSLVFREKPAAKLGLFLRGALWSPSEGVRQLGLYLRKWLGSPDSSNGISSADDTEATS